MKKKGQSKKEPKAAEAAKSETSTSADQEAHLELLALLPPVEPWVRDLPRLIPELPRWPARPSGSIAICKKKRLKKAQIF